MNSISGTPSATASDRVPGCSALPSTWSPRVAVAKLTKVQAAKKAGPSRLTLEKNTAQKVASRMSPMRRAGCDRLSMKATKVSCTATTTLAARRMAVRTEAPASLAGMKYTSAQLTAG